MNHWDPERNVSERPTLKFMPCPVSTIGHLKFCPFWPRPSLLFIHSHALALLYMPWFLFIYPTPSTWPLHSPDAQMSLGIILNCFSLKHICLDLKYTSNPNMYYFLRSPLSTMASLQGSHSLLLSGFPEAQVHPWYPTSFHTVPEGS